MIFFLSPTGGLLSSLCRSQEGQERHLLCPAHANWSGVKKGVLYMEKKFEHHGLREIVIIKYSNISTERHVHINNMSSKQKNRPL